MITCITPTGDRTEAFKLTKKWMASQTLKPSQWIVVDDGFNPLSEDLKKDLTYIRREPSKGEGHTLIKNLKISLSHIKGDKILFIEDDDWYGPNYIKTMSDYLDKYNLVGEGYARYYNINSLRYLRMNNDKNISLCQTGLSKSLLSTFEDLLPGDPYIDLRIWKATNNYKYIFSDLNDELHLHCSMKGLKGRKGIGIGHNYNNDYKVDKDLKVLIKWIGAEAAQDYLTLKLSWKDKLARV